MLVLVKGAGDLASGVACRLYRSGFPVVMTDLPQPTAIRRTVCFSEAIPNGTAVVEGITSRFAPDAEAARAILETGEIPVLADAEAACVGALQPEVLVDAILAKRNLGTSMADAPVVIGLGPGFTAGVDCHAVVETMRGHTLGRVYYEGAAMEDTGVPGNIGGFTIERILRAPCAGEFRAVHKIGDTVEAGEVCAYVGRFKICSAIRGTLRGILPDGTQVYKGMKSGDVDPRCRIEHCFTVSDKALSIGGGVLEALLHLKNERRD